MRFFGANDASTLAGVVEELDRMIRIERRYGEVCKAARDRYASQKLVRTLETIRGYIADAIPNGPTPDLSKLTLVIPTQTRLRLECDQLSAALFGSGTFQLVDDAGPDLDPGLHSPNWRYKAGDWDWSPGFTTERAALEAALVELREDIQATNDELADEAARQKRLAAQDALATEIGYQLMGMPEGDPRRLP
jgi:hypothetical protein